MNRTSAVFALVIVVFAIAAVAQTSPQSTEQAYNEIQALRTEGRRLLEKEPARALPKFEAALAYWKQPLVQGLAAGSFSLDSRYLNLCIDLAEAHGKLNHKTEAIGWLEKAHQAGGFNGFARYLEQNGNLAGLREEAAFQKLLAAARERRDFWESASWKTEYRENISDADKLAGLSRFWSEARYNFAYPERLTEIDWDRKYMEAIPKVLATKSTVDYYRELMRFCALIGDGHTNVYYPDAVKLGAAPPIQSRLVEGRVAITRVLSPAIDIAVGSEILEIDGEDVHAYVKREVAPFQSASTPQDLEIRSYGYSLLRGAPDKPVRLKLRAADGTVAEKTIARSGYTGIQWPSSFEYRVLDGAVAYVRADSFSDRKTVDRWKEKFPEILKAKALIIDLRFNGGGSSDIGWALLANLIEKPAQGAQSRMRRYIPTERAWGMTDVRFVTNPPAQIDPEGDRFTGPVVVLSSGATYSAAEDFLVAFQSSGRGRIVGETSGGSTGQPLFFALPGGGNARICTKQDLMPDGTKWVGLGIRPEVEVKPAWADFVAQRDTVLEAALKLLR